MVEYLKILTPVITFAINVILQISLRHIVPSLGFLKPMVLGFAISSLAVLMIDYHLLSSMYSSFDLYSLMFINWLMLAFLNVAFVNVITLPNTGRRARFIAELSQSEDGLSEKELLDRYSSRDMVNIRLERLTSKKQVIFKDGRYYINGKPLVLLFAWITIALKLLFYGKKTTDF